MLQKPRPQKLCRPVSLCIQPLMIEAGNLAGAGSPQAKRRHLNEVAGSMQGTHRILWQRIISAGDYWSPLSCVYWLAHRRRPARS